MRPHNINLQFLKISIGNARLGQFSKTSIDAVKRITRLQQALHSGRTLLYFAPCLSR